MTTLLLVRHGETDWNAERRWQGHADVPLNERGREQAVSLAEELSVEPALDAIYASDLSRARETAEIVGERLGVLVALDRDLREIEVGSREGLRNEEVGERPWDGETSERHAERSLAALRRIVERHPTGRVLVVAHGGTLRRVQEHAGVEVDGWFGNCAVWVVVHKDGRFTPLG